MSTSFNPAVSLRQIESLSQLPHRVLAGTALDEPLEFIPDHRVDAAEVYRDRSGTVVAIRDGSLHHGGRMIGGDGIWQIVSAA